MPQGRCGVCAVPVARLVAALSLPKFGSEYSNIHEDLRGASTVTNDLSNRLGRVPFVDDALTALDLFFHGVSIGVAEREFIFQPMQVLCTDRGADVNPPSSAMVALLVLLSRVGRTRERQNGHRSDRGYESELHRFAP
jgi:hypothetical protein